MVDECTPAVEVAPVGTADPQDNTVEAQQASDADGASTHWEKIKTLWAEYEPLKKALSAEQNRERQIRIELGREFRTLQENHATPGSGDFLTLLQAKLDEIGIRLSIKTVYAWIKLSREADGLEVRRTRRSRRPSGSSFTQVKDGANATQPTPVKAQLTSVGGAAGQDASGSIVESVFVMAEESESGAGSRPTQSEADESTEAAGLEVELVKRFHALLSEKDEGSAALEFYSVVCKAAKLLEIPHAVLPEEAGITVYRDAIAVEKYSSTEVEPKAA